MSLLDHITDVIKKLVPEKGSKPSASMSGGIGSGHGMVPFEDDMIVPKRTIVFCISQIFFNFLAMACFASVARFQAKWHVGPSGLTGFAIFVSVAGMLLSTFMMVVPVVYEKYDKFVRLARALKEVRVGFILTGTGTAFSLLIAFIVTISAWTEPGCKNANNDPNAEALGDGFKNGLPGWCSTKKAGAIFFWLAFGFWAAALVLLILDWRSGKLHAPRDPPFTRPQGLPDVEEGDEEDEESTYSQIPQQSATRYDNSNAANSPFADDHRYVTSVSPYTPSSVAQPVAAGRPSMDAYGAFSDPAPSGFGTSSPGPGYNNTPSRYAESLGRTQSTAPPLLPEPDMGPRVSRTMQYADPYAAVRASIAGQQSSPTSVPPSYESYPGYR